METAKRVARVFGRGFWRIGVLVVGSLVVLAGVVMIVTPGPAMIVIPAGLAILATEFSWADRLLQSARQRIEGSARGLIARSRRPDHAERRP